MSSMWTRVVVTVLVAGATIGVSATVPAVAGAAPLTGRVFIYGNGKGKLIVDHGQLRADDTQGLAANDVITVSNSGSTYVVATTAGVTAGAGCTSLSSTSVQCPIARLDSISVFPGNGDDVVTLATALQDVYVEGGLVVFGGEGNDRLNGSNQDDDLNGEGGNDVLKGNGGDDELSGGAGVDSHNGGPGNDILSTNDGQADAFLPNCGEGVDELVRDRFDPSLLLGLGRRGYGIGCEKVFLR